MTASAKTLSKAFGITKDQAEAVRAAIRLGGGGGRHAEDAMRVINGILEGHGVEAIRGDYYVDRYHYDIVASYVNMGDTYNATIVYETETGRFIVTSYGDWVERNERKYKIS